MADKKDTPKHIKEYIDNIKKEKKLIDTTEHHHRQAYDHAMDQVLKDKKTGLINHDLLDLEEHQQKFADTMADFYLDRALEHFGYKKKGEEMTDKDKLDVFQKDRLMKAYANTSRGELRRMLAQHGKGFADDYSTYHREKENMMRPLRTQLQYASASHLTDENIESIIDYTGAKDMVERKHMRVDDAASLLRNWHRAGGTLPKKDLDDIVNRYAVKDKYKKGYDLKGELDKKKKTEDKTYEK